MENPFVSVITPSYQSARYIQETIESVKKQDYPYIEHIIVDGGSSDGTIEILKAYPHLKWVSEKDRGQSHALNKGFKMARGEIFGWLNSDDTYNPGAVSQSLNYLTSRPDADMVCSDIYTIDNQSNRVVRRNGKPFNLTEHLFENFVRQPSVFMRRNIIEEVGGVDETLNYCMDRELWLRIGARHNIQYYPNLTSANLRYCEGTKTFENSPQFSVEWRNVLQKTIDDPNFRNIPLSIKKLAIQKYRARYHIQMIQKAISKKNLSLLFSHTYSLLTQNWIYILKYPYYKIFVQNHF
jgi:glycosyltransferase involved in cell wall biosynthesis